jgi:hypothetical protein
MSTGSIRAIFTPPAGGAHWGDRPYGVPSQTTPELLFYRKDLVRRGGSGAAATTKAAESGRRTARPVARALRHRLECGARHGARPHLHDDLRGFRPAGHRSAQGGRRLRCDAAAEAYRPMIDTPPGWRRPNTSWSCCSIRRPTSCRCPGTSASAPLPPVKSPWPMATRCWPPISSSTHPRRHRQDRLPAASGRAGS